MNFVNGLKTSVKFDSTKELFVDANGNTVDRSYRFDLFGGYIAKEYTNAADLLSKVKEREESLQRSLDNLKVLKSQLEVEASNEKFEKLKEQAMNLTDEQKQAMRSLLA
jgi:hypothetical protein